MRQLDKAKKLVINFPKKADGYQYRIEKLISRQTVNSHRT